MITFFSFFGFGIIKLLPFIVAGASGYKNIDVTFCLSTLLCIFSCMLLGGLKSSFTN